MGKGYFEVLYGKYRAALEQACEQIVELCGTCPKDHLDLPCDGCDFVCGSNIDVDCWMQYFLKERWDDADE
jgi:hypothetical protein